MILALIGKDQFSKDKQTDKFLTDALGDRKNDPLSKQIVYASDTNIPSVAGLIMESCGAVSMFAPEQAVVVRNADAMKADESKALARWLKDAPDCKLLLDFDELRATSELYKILQKVGKIEKYEEPKQYKMQEWIASNVPAHFGKPIEPAASQYLADALGTNTKLVCEELEKALIYDPDCTKITFDLVKTMITPRREIPPYEILNYFGMRDAVGYTRKLHEILYGNKDNDAIRIVNALYSHAVDLLNFMSLTAKKMSAEDAAQALGKNYFMFCKQGNAAECCRRWGKPLLCRVIRRLADLNYEFKSSSWTVTSQELALAALVVR
ncbi:DNA polymerase III, delta subunit [Fibrobacter sp. UWB15]|jgi:DNA polymerase-3 subunit delta|uniref:DNA polymerase III subunit delta n=1 Tax=unclassified Fibrobacter TaxID=2634177 RepID=UPI000923A38D|nr:MULTISPECIES: DNA polymerase III subunit delta [unclassified Fibrobacter]PWJ65061.1 DNA polymerase III delta subunit [Fibrobacter sp. UWB6]SHG10153.1 DNA polymerase III, delta subunit [Fibrobacter sp. UWB8]SMG30540.1 DNA polymerase III, delta subunit [Fibrobacter sp. UWB15]